MHFTDQLKPTKPIDHRGIARDRIYLALVDATRRFTSTEGQLYHDLAADLDAFALELRAHVGRASNQPLHDKNTKLKGL